MSHHTRQTMSLLLPVLMVDSGLNSEQGAIFLKIKLSLQIEEVRILNFKFHQLKLHLQTTLSTKNASTK